MSLFGLAVLIAFFPVVAFGSNLYPGKRFEERFPPIDDDEFMRRCGPGTNREIALRVRRIISECMGIGYYHVYPEHRFVEDLDI